jgi:hypothetical protein
VTFADFKLPINQGVAETKIGRGRADYLSYGSETTVEFVLIALFRRSRG